MLTLTKLVLFCTFAALNVTTFPAAAFDHAAHRGHFDNSTEESLSKLGLNHRQIDFDPYAQLVSTTGVHAFKAPGPGDQRGVCPGLNAMANHGYIPRNGVASLLQFVNGVFDVFTMGTDLGLFLSTYGSVMNGDLTKYSIGGPTHLVPGLLGLLGTPQGISSNNSHNKYEGDASAIFGDTYLYGNTKFVMSQFEQLFDMQPDPATANYDINTIIAFRAARFQHSVQNNPHFFHAPFTGIVASSAAHYFITRMYSNYSEEHPEGLLNQDVLKSFFAVSGPRSAFNHTPGHERIPENWYRRSPSQPYGLVPAFADIVTAGLLHPELLGPGGNTGAVNTYTPVNLADLTGGVFNAQNLLQGSNGICFALQAARLGTPDLISGPGGLLTGILNPVVSALNQLSNIFLGALNGFGCPTLTSYNQHAFDIFPGGKHNGF